MYICIWSAQDQRSSPAAACALQAVQAMAAKKEDDAADEQCWEVRMVEYTQWEARCPIGQECKKGCKLLYKKKTREDAVNTLAQHLWDPNKHPRHLTVTSWERACELADDDKFITFGRYDYSAWFCDGVETDHPVDASKGAGRAMKVLLVVILQVGIVVVGVVVVLVIYRCSAHRLQILDVLQVQVVKAVMEAAVAVATAALNTEDAQEVQGTAGVIAHEIVQRSARGFAHEIVEIALALAPFRGQQTTRTHLRVIWA